MSEIAEHKIDETQEDLANSNMATGANDDMEDDDEGKGGARERRKIEIKFIQDKSRRHITFSKRKAGIMKKAYELSVLTGTQVLLLVVSETGLVYTFTTPKLQPLVTKPEGKNLIQACLNAPEESADDEEASTPTNSAPAPTQAPASGSAPAPSSSQTAPPSAAAAAPAPSQPGSYQQPGGMQNIPAQTGYLNPEQAAVYQTYFGGINSQQNQF